MELGSQTWLDRCCDRINESAEFRALAASWTCPLGLAFLDDEGEPAHHAVLEIHGGRCDAATEVDAERFADAPVKLTAGYPTWERVLDGDLNPLKAIMLRRVHLDGDLLHIVKHAAAARALFECVAKIDAEIPSTGSG